MITGGSSGFAVGDSQVCHFDWRENSEPKLDESIGLERVAEASLARQCRVYRALGSLPCPQFLVERIQRAVFFLFGWSGQLRTIVNLEKMRINSLKAYQEHRELPQEGDLRCRDAYFLGDLPLVEEIVSRKENPLTADYWCDYENQGPRGSMEDSHFVTRRKHQILAGVFDGHALQRSADGAGVARYAKEKFEKEFLARLPGQGGDVKSVFETFTDEVHREVLTHPEWNDVGCTAVVCFVDLQAHCVYTATLGDSEANLYRAVGENREVHSLPLSLVRNWASPKERARKDAIYERYSEDVRQNLDGRVQKKPTFTNEEGTRIEVARSIGDSQMVEVADLPAVSHKPKVTVYPVEPGDQMILACDGLKDYVPEMDIVQQMRMRNGSGVVDSIAALSDLALDNMGKQKKGDNLTIVGIQIGREVSI